MPYWPRADIDAGHAPLAGKELVWVDDAVEAFFLQIQGSGRVQLAEGGVLRIGYADQNGQPFRSIGRVAGRARRVAAGAGVDAGDQSSGAASILTGCPRCWTRIRATCSFAPSRPIRRRRSTARSERSACPCWRERTIAVDPAIVPLGAPVFLATTYPLSDRPLQRLVLAQDTGGAIKGALRADFFWGFGDEAGREAGRMKQQGRMWLLWPKDAALPY